MKGLILIHLGLRDEGINLVKEGMRKDLTSHICWHVWALIQKSERKYEDALKSYVQALKYDKVRFAVRPVRTSLHIFFKSRITSISFEILLSFRPKRVNLKA
jgi:hypothetical protein